VRLDHLLSKEHSAASISEVARKVGPSHRSGCSSDLDHWLLGRSSGLRLVPPRLAAVVGTAERRSPRPHTLLSFEGTSRSSRTVTSPAPPAPGPETPGNRRPSRTPHHPARPGRWASGAGVGNLENYIASASIFECCQVTKGTRWMPWRQKPMKDVGGCDKPRGAANRALIRGCPNGETRHGSCRVTPV
jgi:hypothetical protein